MDNIKHPLREMALFAGAGGGILGGKLLGWRTVCAVEWEPYAASVLCARQNDGFLESFPIWDDVQTFDGRPWRGLVDVVSGGFPCQDISAAGRGAGIDGARSGMWTHMARIIGEVRPRYAFVENSPMLTSRGLDRVLGDISEMGYNAKWGIVSAADTGAPHLRERIWIRATNTYASSIGCNDRCNNREKRQVLYNENRNASEYKPERNEWKRGTCSVGSDVADTNEKRLCRKVSYGKLERKRSSQQSNSCNTWWKSDPAEISESGVDRMAHGMAFGVHRLKAIGNGQVPMAAAMAWELLE